MGVVLGEAAHPGKSVQLAALLVTVNGSEFCQTYRQVLVGTRLAARFRLSPSLYLVFSRVRVDFSGMFRKRFFLKLKLDGMV